MARPSRRCRRQTALLLRGPVLAVAALALAVHGASGQAVGPAAPAAPAPALTLTDCISMALARQPALAAHRASLAAAEAQKQALDHLCLASLVSRELPIRRQQAADGVIIAAAGLQQAEWETIYGVTRNYLSILYAHEQEKVVRGLVNTLNKAQEKAKIFSGV